MDVVRPRLKRFVKEMDRRLARPKNQRKADWRNPRACDVFSLFEHARKELGELEDELPLLSGEMMTPARAKRIAEESADLANMAMMVADRAYEESRGAQAPRSRASSSGVRRACIGCRRRSCSCTTWPLSGRRRGARGRGA